MLGESAALGAAMCWTFSSLLAAGPVREVGTMPFARVRLVVAFLAVGGLSLLTGGWQAIEGDESAYLILSGLVGFALGDYWLFAGYRILGPRRASIVFALNAPMTALMGAMILGEPVTPPILVGTVLAVAGVMLAIAFRHREAGAIEIVRGSLAAGIVLCLGAAACQAGGTILAKPAMEGGVDPMAAATLRVGTAALVFAAMAVMQRRLAEYRLPRRVLALTVLHASLGPGIGAALMMYAVGNTTAGIAAVLSALSPVLILPILRFALGERLHWGCWAGAAVTVVGTVVIFTA